MMDTPLKMMSVVNNIGYYAGGSNPAWGDYTRYKHVLCSIWSLLSQTCVTSMNKLLRDLG